MEKNSPKKSRTSARIKVANVFGLLVLAVAFFAFPLTTFARSHENHVGLPGSGPFPRNNPRLQRSLQNGNNNGDNSDDNNNNGDNSNDNNNNGCDFLPFDPAQLLKFLRGICGNTGNDPSDNNDPNDNNNPSNSNLPFDPQAFQQQLIQFLQGIHGDIGNDPSNNNDPNNNNDPSDPSSLFDATAFQQQLLKFLDGICTDIGNNNCDPTNGNTTKRNSIANASQVPTQDAFTILGVFEQSGQPFGSKPSSQTRTSSKITLVKVKSFKDVQKGFFITGKDSKGNTFTGEIISPNQSLTKQAIGLINGQGKPQIVTLTL